MELFLQFGYGMMEHCRHLVSEWSGGTVILSPRDLTEDQLLRMATSINELPNGNILLDPQFYLPHEEHDRLSAHSYWPDSYETGAFWSGPALTDLLSRLTDLNHALGSQVFILPGLLASVLDDDWFEIQSSILEEATSLNIGLPLYVTIALSAEAANQQHQVAELLENARSWRAGGYYLVCEHPNGNYLVKEPNWLANVLDLAAGLRLNGAVVILGYCNHQSLIAACAKASAICSGT